MAIPFPSRIDIPAATREPLLALLNQQLADTLDLRNQTKHAHWNVKGPAFIALHKLFDELTDELDEIADDTAERATALGGVAHGTARQVAAASRVPEFPANVAKDLDVVKALAERYAAVAKSTRAAIDEADKLGDKDTADLFTGASRELDKSLWFLEAHLHG